MKDARGLELPPVQIPVEDVLAVRQRARRRIRIVGALLGMGLSMSAARGVQLATDPDERVLAIAADKRWRSVRTQGERGLIYDSEGHVLARSVLHPAVAVDPETVQARVENIPAMAAQLATYLGLPASEIEAKLRAPKSKYKRLAKGVHPHIADSIRDANLVANGVIIEESFRRYYPQGQLAAQVVGFVDESGDGQQGLERRFHAELAGSELLAQRRINRRGSVIDGNDSARRSVEGYSLRTTLDSKLQRGLERALEETVRQSRPISASAVLVEVTTGRILAMSSAPTYDPNHMERLGKGEFSRTRNLAISAVFEPGSVLKPFTMATALQAGVARPHTVLNTESPMVLHDVKIRDDHPRKRMTVNEMIKYSSNIGAARLAADIGADGLLASFEAFGFGERTGIDSQGEARGRRRPSDNFGPVELATVSFGQGLTVTTLQLAMATAALGNEGRRMRPLLISEMLDNAGNPVRTWKPMVVRQAVSPEVASDVLHAMELVLQDGGTGIRARVPGYRVAGKTGTAEKAVGGRYGEERIATFVGLVPAQAPRFAMAVLVDAPQVGSRYGGSVAGPVFSSVMLQALQQAGIAPTEPIPSEEVEEDEEDLFPPLPERDAVRLTWHRSGWILPDLRGRAMRDVLAGLQGSGLDLRIEGSGVLASQSPSPGKRVAPGQPVRLSFQ